MTTLNMDLAITETAYGKLKHAVDNVARIAEGEPPINERTAFTRHRLEWVPPRKIFTIRTTRSIRTINVQLQEYAKLTGVLYNEMLQWMNKADHLFTGGVNIGPVLIEVPDVSKPKG